VSDVKRRETMTHITGWKPPSNTNSKGILEVMAAVTYFREVLLMPSARRILAAATPSHPEPPTGVFEYTFDEGDVVNALESEEKMFVVHHGPPVERPNISMVKFLDEHLIPFVPRVRAAGGFSRGLLEMVLTNKVSDWSEFGLEGGEIKLIAHGGKINKTMFSACVEANFGRLEVEAPITFVPSYTELANAARESDDCVVFGLRPAFVDVDRLAPAFVDPTERCESPEGNGTAHVPIQLAFRSDREVPRSHILDYLDAVAANLNADAAGMARMQRIKIDGYRGKEGNWVAPRAGLEPATQRLTAACSTC
jgi:hypothetical protein